MARITVSVDNLPKHAKPTPKAERKVFRHGPPRWGYAFRRGKGGLEVRPPYLTVGQREQPKVSESKATMLRNVAATAALKHGIAIPGWERVPPQSVQANVEALRKQIAKLDAKEEAEALDTERRNAIKAKYGAPMSKAKAQSHVVVCGKCAKVIAALTLWGEYVSHKSECPERPVIWKMMCDKDPDFKRAWALRKDMLRQIQESAPKSEDELTKSDLANEFNASDVAIAAHKELGAREMGSSQRED